MEALPDGGVLEGESQIIGLIMKMNMSPRLLRRDSPCNLTTDAFSGDLGGDDLSMVEASMLQSEPSVNVMMDFVGDDDEALSAAFSNTFTNASSTTTPSSARLSSSLAPFTTSSYSTTSSFSTTSSSSFTTPISTQVDRGGGVVELAGHQNPLPTPLLLTHQHHHQHHHHPTQPIHTHPVLHQQHHHHHQRGQPSQPSQHPHPPQNYFQHEQVPVSPGRSQGGGYTIGGGFAPYISPSQLQSSHPSPLHEAHPQFLPPIKSEPTPGDSFILGLKTEPQEEFIDTLESHLEPPQAPTPTAPITYNPHPQNNIIVGRSVSAMPYPHHGPPSAPSPSGLSSVEANGTPSPAPHFLYPSHSNAPYLLELAPIPSRQQHQPSQSQSQHQQNQQHNQPQQLSPSANANGLTSYDNSLDSRPVGLGYYEPSQLPQEDARQVSTQGTHMMYLPVNQHNLKTRLKVNRKKSSTPSPLTEEDSSGQKHIDQASNDSDEDNLIIDTSSGPGEGFECGECGLVCRTRGGLRKHLTTEHIPDEPEPAETIPKQYLCTMPLCPFTTTKRDDYDLHIASHIAEGWTPTGKKRQNKNPLQRHRYNKEELTCPLCEYSCTVEKAFRRHLKTHESGQRVAVSKVSCCICGKDRPNEPEMKKHMKKHRHGKFYRCDICKFQTVQLKKLIQHRRMHTGEKPHLCPFCPYRAARRDNLRSHVRRMHKRENMYGDTFTPRPVLLAEADCQDHLSHPLKPEQHQQQVPGTPIPGPTQPHPPPQAPL